MRGWKVEKVAVAPRHAPETRALPSAGHLTQEPDDLTARLESGFRHLVLRVTLDQAEPAVRREIAEPEDYALCALHRAILDAMGSADRDFDPEAFDLARVEFRDPEKYFRQTFVPRRKRG